MAIRFAHCMSRLGTETAFEVLARARALEAQGRQVIHLEIGEPDFDTPANITAAAVSALQEGFTHYGPSAGLPEFRQAIAAEISRSRGIPVAPEEVVVVPGGKPIIYFAITALVNPGDEVIYPNPGFPIYESVIRFVGGKAVPIPIKEELGFGLDVDELSRLVTPKTTLVILNSPANPTGGLLLRSDLERIADLARRNDFYILSDEIYCRILYEGRHESITTFPGMKERTILLDGFSKTYAMTGWRLGYGVMPKEMAEAFSRLQTNVTSCTATFIQKAGIRALQDTQEAPQRMVAEFKKRRDLIVEGLNRIPGVSCLLPQGAFYVFPNVKKLGMASKALADRLLTEADVAVLSGTAFGKYGEGYLRLSYANAVENIREALARIDRFVKAL